MVGNRFLIYYENQHSLYQFFQLRQMWFRPITSSRLLTKSSALNRKEGNGDFEKASSDYMPIPDWLSSVLNWLPPENHKSRTATFKEERPGQRYR